MFLRILDRLEEILIATLMALATLSSSSPWCTAICIGVPFLYPILFPINLSWAQELCIYMFVWVAKFGAAYGVRTGIHVGVDVLVNQLKPPWRNAVVLFGLFCGALFTAVIGTMGAKFVIELYAHRPGVARPRNAELDRLSLHSARLLSDVLPLPAGRLELLLAPANCRITTTPMSRASTSTSRGIGAAEVHAMTSAHHLRPADRC